MERITITVHHFVTMVTVLLTLTALIIACLAISGHIDYRDNSIKAEALDIPSGFEQALVAAEQKSEFQAAINAEVDGLTGRSALIEVTQEDLAHLAAHYTEAQMANSHVVVDTDGLALKSGSGNYTKLKTHNNVGTTYTLTFPESVSAGVMSTDASGNITMGTVSGASKLQDINDGDSGVAYSLLHNEQLTFGTSTGKLFLIGGGGSADIEMDASNIILDAAADITLDADGDDIIFKFGGSIGQMKVTNENTGDVVIQSQIDAKDLVFKQNDGTETLRLTDAAEVEVKDNLRLKSDSAVLSFGADSEYTITHANDIGLTFAAPTITTSSTDDYALKLTQTLNDGTAGGATEVYTMLEANLIESAVAGWDNVYLMDLQVGGTTKFRVNNSGNTTVAGTLNATGALTASTTLGVTGVATFSSHVELGDSDILKIGGSADLQIQHNATNSLISNSTGQLQINGAPGSEVVFNEDGANVDFRIEGDAKNYLFFADASTDRLGVSENAPQTLLHVTQGSGTVPALEGETGFLLQNNTATDTSSMMCILSGNAGNSQINFGDTDDDRAAVIKYSHSTNSYDIRGNGTDSLVTISSTGNVNMKNTATTDDTPMILTLQTGETDIAADDKLGVINFQAPDEGTGTDAILVAAGIEAISEGDFSSSSNATKLSFKTGASEAATEKMTISSVGNVNMKNTATTDDTPMILTLQTGETDIAVDDKLGVINFQAPDEGTGTDAILVAAGIEAISEGDFSATNNATKLSFKTASSEAAAEKMSLSSGGNLKVSGGINSGIPIVMADAASTDLVHATHSGRILVLPIVGQDSTYNLPTPVTPFGEHYHFIYGGTAAEAHEFILRTKTTDNSVLIQGSVNFIITDPDATATNAQLAAIANGTEILTIHNAAAIDVHFVSISASLWYVWGTVSSDTTPAWST